MVVLEEMEVKVNTEQVEEEVNVTNPELMVEMVEMEELAVTEEKVEE